MPSPIVALDLIKVALRHLGVLAESETPPADQAQDGLRALNDVLETWSNESLAVWGSSLDVFATVPGQATYTIGPGGNWNIDRPSDIAGGYTTWQGVDFPFSLWSLAEYEAVPIKTVPNAFPQRAVFINDSPLAQIILYPTPNMALAVHLDAPRILTQIPNVSTTLTLPPGYARALQYAVAVELAPSYGSPRDLTSQARSTLALLKRTNRQSTAMVFDPALLSRRFNILEG